MVNVVFSVDKFCDEQKWRLFCNRSWTFSFYFA